MQLNSKPYVSLWVVCKLKGLSFISVVAACSSSSECEADFGAMSELFEDLDDDDAW